jgi:UDP-N-acetyl-3-dehydro-alpha-D-glucosamine 3-aminotranferase
VTPRRVPFLSLTPAEDAIAVRDAIDRVVASGWFVLGPELERFEHDFAQAMGAAYAVGTGNGTDALALILRAIDVGPGDEVITTALSAAYTALAVVMVGARPVFADIDPVRFTIDPASVAALIGPRTRAILPVHLYGQAADMVALEQLSSSHNLAIVEDCCQAHMATANGRPVGTVGVAGAFSFYPTKNLGALGDGGAVITNDRALADRVRRLRNGGQVNRYRHEELGVNSRLDELQAAILGTRLSWLRGWTERRRQLAARYREALASSAVLLPRECDPGHVYHLFVVQTDARDALQGQMNSMGVETLIHYPTPIPKQPAFSTCGPVDCPVAASVSRRVLSLPLHPGLVERDLAQVTSAVLEGLALCGR